MELPADQLKVAYITLCIAGAVAVGFGFYFVRRYISGGVCRSNVQLYGKTVIITGANTGIGKETAIDLAGRNARVILACRSVEKGEKAAVEVREKSGNSDVVFRQLDLASLTSVRQFATKILEEEPRIDILINNAGIMGCPYSKTKDGFEMHFGVNHLGHFFLTNLLLDRLKEAPSARIVNVSALAYIFAKMNFDDINLEMSYSPWPAYCRSKLANILFTRALAKRLVDTSVIVNALHPGIVNTELSRYMISSSLKVLGTPFFMFTKTPRQGAQTSIYCAVSEEMEGVTGQYLADCKIAKIRNALAIDDAVVERLWQVSAEMVGHGCKSSTMNSDF